MSLKNRNERAKLLGIVAVTVILFIISLIKYDRLKSQKVTSLYFAQNTHLLVTNASNFDPNTDWMALFHIQKTSGSSWDYNYMIGSLMVREKRTSGGWHDACYQQYGTEIDQASGKVKRIRGNYCRRPAISNESWYLSWNEKNFGWGCGLHPYLNDLKNCVQTRFKHLKPDNLTHDEFVAKRFHYITLLREPVKRFFSEFKHTSMSGTLWTREMPALTKGHQCANDFHKRCTPSATGNWGQVTLEEYMSCEHNLAFNRQTRMLAGYDDDMNGNFTLCQVVNSTWYGGSIKHDEEMFSRAIQNLHSLSFFGLAEKQIKSKKLFVKMFSRTLRFRDLNRKDRLPLSLRLLKGIGFEYSSSSLETDTIRRIREMNHLDVRLYEYAKELFQSRLEYYNIV